MSTKIKKRRINGTPRKMTMGELMDAPEKAMPTETLEANDIVSSDTVESITPVEEEETEITPEEAKAKRKRAKQESGHGVNFNTFGQLIGYVVQVGTPPYNPPGTRLPLANLKTLQTTASEALAGVQLKKQEFETAINLRSTTFDMASPKSAQVYGLLMACGADAKVISDFRTYANILNGKRGIPIDPDSTDKHISASHKSFGNRIQAWKGIVATCAGFVDFESNEAEFTIAGLTAFGDELEATNATAQEAHAALKLARILRDEVFYAPKTGLVPVALDVKGYFKLLFGYKSPIFKAVNGLKFRNLMPK
ncbi:hypothetical protein M0G43_09350 [Subsaxibacter sp. CAU 1640]|uniref:hypothetical protein n=1 Tax=Subsaxibacter sp. CAU 1640 TaxID=2933271 RepID=UPI0020046445|nr:hypothetical protein [Subsaxibacter sp. CAU 1640]MCK7590779.1 hypothetical protein [Subsaxibacter sp. CAU 1640]